MVDFNIYDYGKVVSNDQSTNNATTNQTQKEFNIYDHGTVIPESNALNTVMQFFGGFNDALFYLPDYSIEQVTKGLVKAGFIDETEAPSLAEFFNQGIPEPKTTAEKVLRTTGSETAKSLPIVAGTAAAAASKAYTGIPQIKTTTDAVVKSVLDNIRNNPLTSQLAELFASVGFGAGTGIAEETMPESAIAQTVVPIAGGFAPSVATTTFAKTPTAIALKIGGKLKSYFSKEAQNKRAAEETYQQFKTAFGEKGTPLGDETEASFKRAKEIQESIGEEFVPSPAEITGSPQLIVNQKHIENNATGSDLDALVSRKKKNIKEIEGYVAKTFPHTGEETPFVVDTLNSKLEDLSNINSLQMSKTIGVAENLAKKFPLAEKAIEGGRIRQTLLKKREEAINDFNKYAETLNLDLNVEIPFSAFKNTTLEKFKPKSIYTDVEAIPSVIKTMEKEQGETITFSALKDLRETVSNKLLDQLSSSDPNNKLIRNLTILKQDIDTFLSKSSDSLGKDYQLFREAYKERVINRFEKSAAFTTQDLGKTQEFIIADEKVADAFLKDVNSAKQFKTAFTDPKTKSLDQDALQSMENVILDKVAKKAFDKNGYVDPAKLQTFINNNREVLNEFPTILSKLENTSEAAKVVANRIGQLNKRKTLITENILAKKIAFGKNPLMKGDMDMDKFIANAITQPSLMAKISNRLKTPNEKDALRTSVAKVIFETMDVVNNPDSLKQFLIKNDKSLRYVFTPEHRENLNIIADAYKMALRTGAPLGTSEQPPSMVKEFQGAFGISPAAVMSRFYNVKRGVTSMQYIFTDMMGRFFMFHGKKKSEELFKQSMFNPDLAKTMADYSKIEVEDPILRKKLNGFLFNMGYPNFEEEKKKPLNVTIPVWKMSQGQQ